jgi:hypothetical protein
MFVVHQESQGKPNMEFRVHKCGLHYYDPRNEKHLAFVNTVSKNKEGFTKRQIKSVELAWILYKTLSYPSMKDFKWVIQSNQIKDFPGTVQDIDVARKIWGKNIAALKGKTTQSKSIPVDRDYAMTDVGSPFVISFCPLPTTYSDRPALLCSALFCVSTEPKLNY